jgi:hypothetical protein
MPNYSTYSTSDRINFVNDRTHKRDTWQLPERERKEIEKKQEEARQKAWYGRE